MKKITNRILALMLMAIMTLGMITGCNKVEKNKKTSSDAKSETVFAAMKQMSEMEQMSLETTLSMDNVDGVSGDVTLKIKRDGSKASLGIDINAAGMIFELEDLLIVDGDTLYLNVKEVEDELGALLSSAQIDLSAYGITADWLSLTLDGMPENTGVYGTMFEDFDKAYKNLFSEKNGEYTLKIDDEDSYRAFIEATKKLLEDNKEAWADMITEYYGSFDVKAMAEGVMDEVIDKFVAKCQESLGETLDEDEIRAMVEDSMDIDMDELEMDFDRADIVATLEDAVEEIDSADYEDLDCTIELASNTKKGESTISGKISHEDESISFTMKAAKDTSGVTVPSDADSMIDVLIDVIFALNIDSTDDVYSDMLW